MEADAGVLAVLAVRCSGVCRMVDGRRRGGGGRGKVVFGEGDCLQQYAGQCETQFIGVMSGRRYQTEKVMQTVQLDNQWTSLQAFV